MRTTFLLGLCLTALISRAQDYTTQSKTLPNGLKMIVCEKPGVDFCEVEVWYRVGSKDEKSGIRGMAHMFEHMMFRGTKNFPGNSMEQKVDSVGGQWNAYTTYDRTVYHEYVPVSALDLALNLESDRMANLVVTQEILNTERQVVGEELRNGLSNWYQKAVSDRYPFLYPAGHPYEVDVIGNLDEITAFTSPQCMDFYNNYYSPNNAFLVVAGNVKAADVFARAEKYFGPITKQLKIEKRSDVPDLMTAKLKQTDLEINFPVQIYTYTYPRPAADSKDFFAMLMLESVLFSDGNSILNNRLVKQDYSAYGLQNNGDSWSMYPNRGQIDIIMAPQPGNVKVKKAVREEINKIAQNGLAQEKIDAFIANVESNQVTSAYSSQSLAAQLGQAEYYFSDYNRAKTLADDYRKVTQDDLKRVAATYLADDKVEVINMKPGF